MAASLCTKTGSDSGSLGDSLHPGSNGLALTVLDKGMTNWEKFGGVPRLLHMTRCKTLFATDHDSSRRSPGFMNKHTG
jgi:hypothetical protein